MASIILVLLILLICTTIGLSTLKLIEKNHIEENTIAYWSILPIIGAIIIINFAQVMALFLNMRNIGILFMFLLIFCLLYIHDNILVLLKKIIEKKILMILIILIITIVGFPIITHRGLSSIQAHNNDIIYYLSTMDWLQDHTLLEPVKYSEANPYYFAADYILNSTRFGADIFGALLMSFFQVEAHEIFSILGVSFAVMSSAVVYFMSTVTLKLSKKIGLVLFILVGCGYNWTELLMFQYIPQIIGIGCLLGFVSGVMNLYLNFEKKWVYITSIFLVGTVATYAEFSSYILIIFLGLFIIDCFYSKKKNIVNRFYIPFKVAIISILMNPIAIWIAIKFNLKILLAVKDSPSNIDAFGGNIKSFTGIITRIIGGLDIGKSGKLEALYSFGIYLFVALFIFSFIYNFIKYKSQLVFSITWVLFFFLIYEFYFRSAKLAYGEHKHLISIVPFIIIYFVFFMNESFLKFNIKYKQSIFSLGILLLFIVNILSVYWVNKNTDYYYYDDDLKELSNAGYLISEDDKIGISSDFHGVQHAIIYAMNNHLVHLINKNSYANSYYASLAISDVNTKYNVYDKKYDKYNDIIDSGKAEVWHNEKYIIIEHKTSDIECNIKEGFYEYENDFNGGFRWTSANKSTLEITNNTQNATKIEISFYAGNSPTGAKNIKVYSNDKLIGESTTDNRIETDIIDINAGEKILISIISEEDLSSVSTDARKFGFLVRDVKIQQIN